MPAIVSTISNPSDQFQIRPDHSHWSHFALIVLLLIGTAHPILSHHGPNS